MVETHQESMTMPTETVSQTHHANNTLLRTLTNGNVNQWTSVKTAKALPQLKVNLAKKTAGPLTTRSTTSLTTTVFQESTR